MSSLSSFYSSTEDPWDETNEQLINDGNEFIRQAMDLYKEVKIVHAIATPEEAAYRNHVLDTFERGLTCFQVVAKRNGNKFETYNHRKLLKDVFFGRVTVSENGVNKI